MTFLSKSKYSIHTMVLAVGIFITALLCGCSYHGQLKQVALSDKHNITAAKINLLNHKKDIKNISFKVGVGTFNYDTKEVYFNALKNTFMSRLKQAQRQTRLVNLLQYPTSKLHIQALG